MKRIYLLILAAVLSVGAISARDKSVAPADLPRAAQLFIEKNFGKNKVHHAKVDSKMLGAKEYEVILKDGTELEFDKNGALTDIDCGIKEVPSKVVPAPIRDYVKRYFPGQKIHSLEVKSSGYEVDLGNGVEIEFDKAGNFKKVD